MVTTADWLSGVRVAAPCTESWDGMTGDERTRACAKCARQVWNLSTMTRTDAEAFVQQATGRTCVRFWRRADGTVLTADCPVGVSARRRRVAALAAACAAAVGAIAALVSGWTGRGRGNGAVPGVLQPVVDLFKREPPARMVMGEMVCPTPVIPPPSASPAPAPGEPDSR